MSKETAVEWLIEQIGWYNLELLSDLRFEIDKAKAMEKEQIVDAFNYARYRLGDSSDYYNETYGGDK